MRLPTFVRPGRLPRWILALIVCAGTPAASSAQAEDAALRRAVGALSDSALVRVIAPGLVVDPGIFVGVYGDSLRLRDADVVLNVAFDEVEQMSVRGTQWLDGALLLAGTGFAFGAAMGFFKGTQECEFEADCGGYQLDAALRWGSRVGLVGALVGAVVGSRRTTWRTLFP